MSLKYIRFFFSVILATASPCASLPCYNGGSCTDVGADSFQCRCPARFTGDRCEIEGRILIT